MTDMMNLQQAAIAVVAPAVIEAEKALGIALRLAANDGAAVAAHIQVNTNFRFRVAAKNDRTSTNIARLEIAGSAHFGFMTNVNPAGIEDLAHLVFEYLRLDQRATIDLEVMIGGIVDDEFLR